MKSRPRDPDRRASLGHGRPFSWRSIGAIGLAGLLTGVVGCVPESTVNERVQTAVSQSQQYAAQQSQRQQAIHAQETASEIARAEATLERQLRKEFSQELKAGALEAFQQGKETGLVEGRAKGAEEARKLALAEFLATMKPEIERAAAAEAEAKTREDMHERLLDQQVAHGDALVVVRDDEAAKWQEEVSRTRIRTFLTAYLPLISILAVGAIVILIGMNFLMIRSQTRIMQMTIGQNPELLANYRASQLLTQQNGDQNHDDNSNV